MPPEERLGEQMQRVRQFVLSTYQRQGLHDVWLVAPRFVSTMRQDVAAHQLLPVPVTPSANPADRDLLIEPSVGRAIERLAQVWVESVCVEAFWSARRAEYAARAIHMEVSRQELAKRTRLVRHEFFKTLHERVDVLVRETCVVQRHAARRAAAQRARAQELAGVR